jgi:LmbE family N-acetylglucosaminyl deacetylase
VVVTIFGSGPTHVDPLTNWDLRCGVFQPGDNIAAIRAREDDDAMATLGATGVRLEFWEEPYRPEYRPPTTRLGHLVARWSRREAISRQLVDDVTAAIGRVVKGSDITTWFAPLGINHTDHKVVAAAMMQVMREYADRQWIVYEELPYACAAPRALATAHRRIRRHGFELQTIDIGVDADRARKGVAVGCYRSQVAALGSAVTIALAEPERFYLVTFDRRDDHTSNSDQGHAVAGSSVCPGYRDERQVPGEA